MLASASCLLITAVCVCVLCVCMCVYVCVHIQRDVLISGTQVSNLYTVQIHIHVHIHIHTLTPCIHIHIHIYTDISQRFHQSRRDLKVAILEDVEAGMYAVVARACRQGGGLTT